MVDDIAGKFGITGNMESVTYTLEEPLEGSNLTLTTI